MSNTSEARAAAALTDTNLTPKEVLKLCHEVEQAIVEADTKAAEARKQALDFARDAKRAQGSCRR